MRWVQQRWRAAPGNASATAAAIPSAPPAEVPAVPVVVADVRGHRVVERAGLDGVRLDPGGHAEGHRAGGDLGARRDHGPGGHQGARADQDPLQDDRPGADQAAVLDHAALEVGVVADHAVIADDRVERRGAVDDGAVLDRGAGPHPDRAVVAAQHRGRPDGRLGAERHVADDHGVGVHERLRVDLRDAVTQGVQRHLGLLSGPHGLRSSGLRHCARPARLSRKGMWGRSRGGLCGGWRATGLAVGHNAALGASYAAGLITAPAALWPRTTAPPHDDLDADHTQRPARASRHGGHDGHRLRHPAQDRGDELAEDSLEELKARRAEAQSGVVDVDEAELAETLELPGADLSNEEFSVRVIPRQADEFTCSRCFLVHHRSQLASRDRPAGVPGVRGLSVRSRRGEASSGPVADPNDEVGRLVAQLAAGHAGEAAGGAPLDPDASAAKLAADLSRALAASAKTAGTAAVASGRWLGQVLIDVAPHLPSARPGHPGGAPRPLRRAARRCPGAQRRSGPPRRWGPPVARWRPCTSCCRCPWR